MKASETAVQRLGRSRTRVVQWLDQDETRRDAFSHTGLGQLTALPWIRRLASHPLASLAMGALTKWWMKPRARPSPATGMLAVGTGLGLLRRRPLLTLGTVAVIGSVAWWTQRQKRPARAPAVPATRMK